MSPGRTGCSEPAAPPHPGVLATVAPRAPRGLPGVSRPPCPVLETPRVSAWGWGRGAPSFWGPGRGRAEPRLFVWGGISAPAGPACHPRSAPVPGAQGWEARGAGSRGPLRETPTGWGPGLSRDTPGHPGTACCSRDRPAPRERGQQTGPQPGSGVLGSPPPRTLGIPGRPVLCLQSWGAPRGAGNPISAPQAQAGKRTHSRCKKWGVGES